MHRAGKTNINADLISRATHMDDPPPSDTDSITQGNQDMFPLPWKQLKIGEKPNLIEMNQVTLSTENNCPSSKYLPPSCKGKICTIIQPPWHLAGSRSDEGRGPPLIGTFKGKILIDQVDLEKAQNEDSALLLVKSWFNSDTGKIDEKINFYNMLQHYEYVCNTIELKNFYFRLNQNLGFGKKVKFLP